MAAATPTGKATTMVMATTHSEPRMAVRTPAFSGTLDCEPARKRGFSQARKETVAPGWRACSRAISWRDRSASLRYQEVRTRGATTRSTTTAYRSSRLRWSSGCSASRRRSTPAERCARRRPASCAADCSSSGTPSTASVAGSTVFCTRTGPKDWFTMLARSAASARTLTIVAA